MSGKLFIVGTPIGNLSDLSSRAEQTLREVSFIAAEDTRVTRALLARFDIHRPLISYYEHNKFCREGQIIERISAGEDCALVTDAGMPAISDPGRELVRACREAGIEVSSVPGPTALTTALSLSGMASGRFCFEGFLSVTPRVRREHILSLVDERRTMVFYEAPHKLKATLRDLFSALGEREIALCRELTKIHEEIIITSLSKAAALYEETPPRGEFVLIVESAADKPEKTADINRAAEIAEKLIAEGATPSAAARDAAAQTGARRGEIYKLITERKDSDGKTQ